MNRSRLPKLLSVLLVCVLAACQAQAATMPAPATAVPSTAVPPTVAPATAAAPTQTTLSSKIFKLPIRVSYGPDWSVRYEYPDLLTLMNKKANVEDLSFIILKDAKLIDPKVELSAENLVAFPKDFAQWIQDHGLFFIEKTQPVVVAGFKGSQIDAVITFDCGAGDRWLFVLETEWRCSRKGEQYRFITLDDVYGQRVLIMNNARKISDMDFNLGLEVVQKVMDTVVFSKP